jgi:hypothetical protein
MDVSFGLITEGVTDQTVLEAILIGFSGNKNLVINQLQPTEEIREKAGWTQVLAYIESSDFQKAFDFLDFVVVQIDSDVFETDQIPANYQLALSQKSVEEKVQTITGLLCDLIGPEVYKQYQHQILFAIAVGEIECWLLPVYFSNQAAKASKTTGCIPALNEGLKKAGYKFYIDGKDRDKYREISRPFHKSRELRKWAQGNPSFDIFLSALDTQTARARL